MQKSRKKQSFFNTDGKMDITFLSLVLILLTIGLVMLFSASYAFSYENYGNSYRFIARQAIFAVAGVVVMLVVSTINYRIYRKFAWVFYFIVMAILIALLIMPPMLKGMDVKRWLVIGPIN
ncbi:MAG: FtsW/RodA/SpoVE family cell cycle protein, partial [Clostridia bacterium]|nr:FtsW/RodA/SpoVE family cell cycle protein [Clostridia bacterium]